MIVRHIKSYILDKGRLIDADATKTKDGTPMTAIKHKCYGLSATPSTCSELTSELSDTSKSSFESRNNDPPRPPSTCELKRSSDSDATVSDVLENVLVLVPGLIVSRRAARRISRRNRERTMVANLNACQDSCKW